MAYNFGTIINNLPKRYTMKHLIIAALNEVEKWVYSDMPHTKKKTIEIDISDVEPKDFAKFMQDNNIPENSWFSGAANSYDSMDYPTINYEIDIPATKEDKLKYIKEKFNLRAFKRVHDTLTTNGYKRQGYNSGLLREFDNTTVYDMYMQEDFDRLVKYYSLPFKPIE